MATYKDYLAAMAPDIKAALKSGNYQAAAQQFVDTTRRLSQPRPSPSRSIDNFKSLLSRGGGMARAAKYEVVLTAPPLLKQLYSDVGIDTLERDVSLQCNTVSMPGHDLQTQAARYGSAPVRDMVTSHGYAGDVVATFYMDEALKTKMFFDAWQSMAVDMATHKANYYSDYIGTMKIYQLGGAGRTYGMEVEEVYPATIGPVEYAYETVDTIALLTVNFNYRKWKPLRSLDT